MVTSRELCAHHEELAAWLCFFARAERHLTMDLVNAVGNAASGAAAALGTGLKDAIGVQEPEDTGEAFARRGHVAMQAHFDESLQRWVFPGEDPMAPTAEEQREMRAAALPPPPKNL